MLLSLARWISGRTSAIRSWQLWTRPRWLACYICAVVLADVVLLAVAASSLSIRVHDLELFGALLACAAATVELTRRLGEGARVVKDVYAVWELPVAILLPIAYAPLIPIVRLALTQLRVGRKPPHRRALTAAAIGISYLAAALVFHATIRVVAGGSGNPGGHALAWMAILALCAAVQWSVNTALVLTAIKGADRTVSLRDIQFAREPVYNDVSELCVAVLVTFCVANSILALAFAFPFVTLLQRSSRHGQLLTESRADSKTGLLNSATWEREATAELARAVRTKIPVAVALLDLDRFKSVNDTYGHLTGDQVLKEVARTLETTLREYDLAGRFGGEEFSLLLPHTRATDAFRIAERLRASIAALRFIAPGATGGERLSVTVSIGVAALDGGAQREFSDLLAAADAALYRAKAGGRDQVQMISTTRGVSAISGPGLTRSINGAAPEPSSVFHRASDAAVS
jgi:diguanylate cyclase (GGDEF)-like protein